MIDQNYGKAKALKRLTWGATSTRNDGVCGYARTPFLVIKSIETKRNGKNEC